MNARASADASGIQVPGDIIKANEAVVPTEIRDLRREIAEEEKKTDVKRERLGKLEKIARALDLVDKNDTPTT